MFLIDINLIILGITVIAIATLGTVVLTNNKHSATNRIFFAFAMLTVAYGMTNYFNTVIHSSALALVFLRLTIFFAVLHSFSLFTFFLTFPEKEVVYPQWYRHILLPITISVALLTLTPYVFSGIEGQHVYGETSTAVVSWGIAPFVLLTIFLIGGGIVLLVRKTLRAKAVEKEQFINVLIGTAIMYSFITIFVLVLPALFLNVRLLPLAPLFILPFIAFTSYAIIRHQLFNIKIVSTELLVFSLWIFLLIRSLLGETLRERLFDGGLLFITIIVGILLIRSVVKEVRAREEIEALATRLKKVNEKLRALDQQKSEFISIATHQLRAPLTSIKGYSSLILEGSYGKVPPKIRAIVDRMFQSSNALALVVSDFLDISRIEQGRMKYSKEAVDIRTLTEAVVAEQVPAVKSKRELAISFEFDAQEQYIIYADSTKLRQVIANLIDNAIKYTQEGSVTVRLQKQAGKIRFMTKDTGIGMSEETIAVLFEKFSRAKDANKANVIGTGLGLYVARQLIEAHGGKIWAESDGEGKGSRFIFEIAEYKENK